MDAALTLDGLQDEGREQRVVPLDDLYPAALHDQVEQVRPLLVDDLAQRPRWSRGTNLACAARDLNGSR